MGKRLRARCSGLPVPRFATPVITHEYGGPRTFSRLKFVTTQMEDSISRFEMRELSQPQELQRRGFK